MSEATNPNETLEPQKLSAEDAAELIKAIADVEREEAESAGNE